MLKEKTNVVKQIRPQNTIEFVINNSNLILITYTLLDNQIQTNIKEH